MASPKRLKISTAVVKVSRGANCGFGALFTAPINAAAGLGFSVTVFGAAPPEMVTLAWANAQVYPTGKVLAPVAQVKARVPVNLHTGAQIQSISRHISLRLIDCLPFQFHISAGKNYADPRIRARIQPQFLEPVFPQQRRQRYCT